MPQTIMLANCLTRQNFSNLRGNLFGRSLTVKLQERYSSSGKRNLFYSVSLVSITLIMTTAMILYYKLGPPKRVNDEKVDTLAIDRTVCAVSSVIGPILAPRPQKTPHTYFSQQPVSWGGFLKHLFNNGKNCSKSFCINWFGRKKVCRLDKLNLISGIDNIVLLPKRSGLLLLKLRISPHRERAQNKTQQYVHHSTNESFLTHPITPLKSEHQIYFNQKFLTRASLKRFSYRRRRKCNELEW